jgi:FkbM family methyltransferase
MYNQSTLRSLPIRFAVWWAAHGIRGRGAVARAIGRWYGPECSSFIKTRSGAHLSIDFANFDIYANIINNGGCWDRHVMDCCARVLRPGDVFLDIGANAGVFTIDLAKAIPGLTVFGIEPQPSLVDHIRRSIQANGFDKVNVLDILLGNEDGEGTLYLTSHAIHASTVPRERRWRELKVRRRTLDGLLREKKLLPPDVVKIDVEGSEFSVLQGAHDMLAAQEPSLIFEADDNMRRMGYAAEDLFRLLENAGRYRFFVIEESGTLTQARAPYPPGNILALAPRQAGRI